jgi:hypothetical protein
LLVYSPRGAVAISGIAAIYTTAITGDARASGRRDLQRIRRPQPNEASLARNCSTRRGDTLNATFAAVLTEHLPLASLGPPDTKELTMPVDLSFFMTADPPPADPEPEPKGKARKVEIQTLIWSKKREKEWNQAMKLASKVINGNFRLPRPASLSPADRKELRTIQQRERRASKAIGSVIL